MNHEMKQPEPPHSEEFERSVLGAVFINASVYYTIAERITRRTFYKERHRIIWDAITEIMKEADQGESSPVDTLTVCDKLEEMGKISIAEGGSYISRLSNEIPTTHNIDYYIEKIRKYKRLRDQNDLAGWMQSRTGEKGADPDHVYATVLEEIQGDTETARSSKKTIVEVDDKLSEQLTPGYDENAYPTGIEQLDTIWGGGIIPSRIYYIGGLQKMGKSTFVLDIVRRLTQNHNFAFDFYSVEQNQVELELKLISAISEIDAYAIRDQIMMLPEGANVNDCVGFNKMQKLRKAREEIRKYNLDLDLQGSPDVRDIEIETRRRLAEIDGEQPYGVVLDYIQNATAGADNSYEDLNACAQKMNDIAKNLDVPVFVLFQFGKDGRKAFERNNTRPRPSHIRGTSKMSDDANHMMIVHRPEVNSDDTTLQSFTQVHQDLSRHGCMPATVNLEMIGKHHKFRSWEGQTPETENVEKGNNVANW